MKNFNPHRFIRVYIVLIFCLLLSIGSIAQVYSGGGLLAYYPLDNNCNDYGGSSYHGIAHSSEKYGPFCNNPVDSGFIFNGSTNKVIDISSFADTFRNNLNLMTIYFKLKFNNLNSDQTVLSLSGPGDMLSTNVFEIEYENGRWQIETETDPNSVNHEFPLETESQKLQAGQCYEMMFVINGTTIDYYRDRTLINSFTYTPAITTCNTMWIAGWASPTDNCCNFIGELSELQFYNKALTLNDLNPPLSTVDINTNCDVQLINSKNGNSKIQLCEYSNNLNIRVFDIHGKLIKEVNKKNTEYSEFELPNSSGLYIVAVTHDKGRKVFKAIR